MKIIKFAILISFLFNSVAYPDDALRPPILGYAGNQDRFEYAKIWGKAERAIEKKFIDIEKRREALDLVRNLERRLSEIKGDIYNTLYAIPAVIEVVKTTQELKDICDSLFNLNIKLIENKIDTQYILWLVIPVIANVAKDSNELKLFIELGVELAENKINPRYTLEYAIPAVATIAQTMQELKDMRVMLLNLNTKLAKNKRDPSYALQHTVPAIAKITKNMQELQDIWSTPLLTLNIKLDDAEAEPGDILESVTPEVVKAQKTTQELKDVYSCLALKVDEAIRKNWNRYKKRVNGLAVTAELISDIIQVKRKHGDFRLVFMPSYSYDKSISYAYFKVLPPAPAPLRKTIADWLTKVISRGL